MRKVLKLGIILLVLMCFIVGCGDDKVTNNSTSTSLIGTWNGTNEGTYDVTGVILTFDSNGNFIFGNAGGTYTTDKSVTPYHIDLVFDEDVMWGNENLGRYFFGLYVITDNKLKANWDPDNRPESFESYGYHVWIKQ